MNQKRNTDELNSDSGHLLLFILYALHNDFCTLRVKTAQPQLRTTKDHKEAHAEKHVSE